MGGHSIRDFLGRRRGVPDPRRIATLAVFDGLVWIRQWGPATRSSQRAFTFDRSGLALVEAVTDARLAMLAANRARAAVT
jgi:hypothetical protein